jgi:hypothetical protein
MKNVHKIQREISSQAATSVRARFSRTARCNNKRRALQAAEILISRGKKRQGMTSVVPQDATTREGLYKLRKY